MFLRQEFRKYLPEVKKESARGRSAQSSRPVPESPSARQPPGPCGRSLRSVPAARQPRAVLG